MKIWMRDIDRILWEIEVREKKLKMNERGGQRNEWGCGWRVISQMEWKCQSNERKIIVHRVTHGLSWNYFVRNRSEEKEKENYLWEKGKNATIYYEIIATKRCTNVKTGLLTN